jgi:hypothetical protein
MPSKRTVHARKSLNEVSASMASAQHEAPFLPHQQVSRGSYPTGPTQTFRGTGKSKSIISNNFMKWPTNPTAYVIDNKKLGLTITTKVSRCPQCFVGPYSNLSVHKKTCPCKTKVQQDNARQRMINVTNGKRQQTLNSMIRVNPPPTKKAKTGTSGASSSSSSSSNQPVAAASSVVELSWKDQAVQLAAQLSNNLKIPYRHRNDKSESKKKWSSKFEPIPKTFSESFTQHQRSFKARGVTSGDPPIEYILTGERVIWFPELFFNNQYPAEDKYLRCRCGCRLRARNTIHCVTISLNGPGLLTSKAYSCDFDSGGCKKHWNGWDKELIAKMPKYVKLQFPFQKYRKICIGNDIIDMARHQTVNGSSFRNLAGAVNEMICVKMERQRSIYYDIEIRRRKRGQRLHLDFATNRDNIHYSIQEFPTLPTSWINSQQLRNALMDRDREKMMQLGVQSMSAIRGEFFASDESMKANKRMRCFVGTSTTLASAITTVRSSDTGECASVYSDKKTTDYAFVEQVVRTMDRNNPDDALPIVGCVDNPLMFSGGLGTRLDDLLAIEREENLLELKLRGGMSGTAVVVINDIDDFEDFMNLLPSDEEVVAVDMEWPTNNEGVIGPVTVVQIALSNTNLVYVVQINEMERQPMLDVMRFFLTNTGVTKVGLNFKADVSKFLVDYQLPRSLHSQIMATCIELGDVVKNQLPQISSKLSLARYCDLVLARRLPKPVHIRRSPVWGRSTLPPEWIHYAALDAKATLMVYEKVKSSKKQAKRPTNPNKNDTSSSSSSSSSTTSSDSSESSNASIEPDPKRSAEWSQRKMRLRILMDIFHIMQRYTSTAGTTHALFKLFCSCLSDAFFVMDPNQVDELRHLIKVTRGLSQEEADRISFKYFKRRVRRIVPRPDLLAQRVDFVIRVFEEIDSVQDDANPDPLITRAVLKEHKNQMKLILAGYCSDPVDRSMYRDIGGKVIRKFLCMRGTNGLEGFHRHLRAFIDVIYMNPRILNVLFHEFMSRWNAKARIRTCGEVWFGMFQFEILNEFDAMVRPYLNGWITRHPLRVNNVIYKPLPDLVEPRGQFGMTPLFNRMKRTVHDAVQSAGAIGGGAVGGAVGGGAGAGGIIDGPDDPILPNAGAALEPGDEEQVEEQQRRAALGEMLNEDPVPLTTPDELELFMQLHKKMIYPHDETDKPLPVDFKELTEQFNRAVVEKWLSDETLRSVYKLKTEALLRIVYDRAAEASMCKELIKPKLDLLKSLRAKLKNSTGFTFPDILPRIIAETDVAAAVVVNPVVVNLVNIPLNDGIQPIAQNLPTSINLQKYTLPSNVSSSQLQKLITKRLEIIDNTRWCPLCKKRAQIFSGGQWELTNNSHKIEIDNKRGRKGLYPTCNECDDRAPSFAEKKQEQDRKRKEKMKLKELVTKQGKGKKKKSESGAGSNPGKKKKRKKKSL